MLKIECNDISVVAHTILLTCSMHTESKLIVVTYWMIDPKCILTVFAVLIDFCVDMCTDTCTDMCKCIEKFIYMIVAMCIDMCTDMDIKMCIDMCIDIYI